LKGGALLELFWGEQPPFALLRSVEGGTFFAVMERRRPAPAPAAAEKVTQPPISFDAM